MSEARPRVVAQPARKAAAPVQEPVQSLAGAARIPTSSKLSQRQSLFDGGESRQAPWGAKPLKLMGAVDRLAEPEKRAPEAPSRSLVLAQPAASDASYPEIDRIVERQASVRPFTQGEAQALLENVEKALTRISAPENRDDSCVKSLSPEAISLATTLKSRLAQTVPGMKSSGSFEATVQELASAEKILECAQGISGSSSGWNIGAIIVLGAAAAGLVYILASGNVFGSSGKKK